MKVTITFIDGRPIKQHPAVATDTQFISFIGQYFPEVLADPGAFRAVVVNPDNREVQDMQWEMRFAMLPGLSASKMHIKRGNAILCTLDIQYNKYWERETLGTDCPERETLGTDCQERETLGTDCPARETLGTDCPEREMLGTDCPERETQGTHCPERETLGSHCAELGM